MFSSPQQYYGTVEDIGNQDLVQLRSLAELLDNEADTPAVTIEEAIPKPRISHRRTAEEPIVPPFKAPTAPPAPVYTNPTPFNVYYRRLPVETFEQMILLSSKIPLRHAADYE